MVIPWTSADRVPQQQQRHGTSAVAARPVRHRSIQAALVERDPDTGVTVQRVVVDDVSQHSPTAVANRAVVVVLDELLEAHPEWPTPRVVDGRVVSDGNPVGEWLYRSGALQEWRSELVPSAMALYPVQRPDGTLPSGAREDDVTRLVLGDSLDATGIRTRARIMSDVLARAEERVGGADVARSLWVSLACGAAVPVLDARAEAGTDSRLVLVDLDEGALAFAAGLAERAGLVQGADFVTLRRDLVRTVIVRSSLVDELGEGRARAVEALGIFEYFNDASAARLLRNAFRLLEPGGVLVVGNMLATRPQLHFNQRGAGWPRLHVRSVEQLVDLVRRAGLPLERTTVSIPQDGVYAVVDVVR